MLSDVFVAESMMELVDWLNAEVAEWPAVVVLTVNTVSGAAAPAATDE